MSATNKTTYYELPIFIGTDTPSWLGDWNNTMNLIDSAINGVHTEAQSASNTANTASGKADANTESIAAMQTEIQTLKTAVQNYDNILNFNTVPLVPSPNNLNLETGGVSYFMVQNTNKTIGKLYFVLVTKQSITNPTSYVYTGETGATGTWYDLLTVEDNCFKLNQGSLPTARNCITLGIAAKYNSNYTTVSNAYIRAWYDGAATHIGTGGASLAEFAGSNIFVLHGCPIFLSGSVYNPDDATT